MKLRTGAEYTAQVDGHTFRGYAFKVGDRWVIGEKGKWFINAEVAVNITAVEAH
jgi:hypothetical protein